MKGVGPRPGPDAMIRFALAVTGIEIALTLGAALVVTIAEGSEPYLTEEDLRVLKLPFSSCQTRRVPRLNADYSFDTRAVLTSPSQTLTVVHMVGATPEEYSRRLEDARARQEKSEGRLILINEPFPGESGFGFRERESRQVSTELVRMRGREILVVRLKRVLPVESSGKVEAPETERQARVVQDQMLQKLGWR